MEKMESIVFVLRLESPLVFFDLLARELGEVRVNRHLDALVGYLLALFQRLLPVEASVQLSAQLVACRHLLKR